MVELVESKQAPTCDRGTSAEPCTAAASFAYQWDWGEKGICCSLHATLLQQVAGTLNRQVMTHPLLPSTPAPLTRSERVQLQATQIVLNEELEDAKARGLELYRANGELVRQNNLLTVREREAVAQLNDVKGELAFVRDQLSAREQEHANLVMEVERLRTVEALVSGLTAPEKGNVVDG